MKIKKVCVSAISIVVHHSTLQCKELQGQLLDPGTPLVDSTDVTLVDKDANSILPSGVRLVSGNLAMQVAPPGKMGCIWISRYLVIAKFASTSKDCQRHIGPMVLIP